ncbi:hypothetical protein NC653_030140 [Populus alba x Populus x berolinensis]|uniref:non-specific serine/threonine protein kinase n=1 Tax=Populus alba x Populus x berolinensis TaxID=444605 RepID=A0AAD6LVD0_9ROSI|nr:hypothetical protein NC653_030140 [Populus alba x Populus x berolinensis]
MCFPSFLAFPPNSSATSFGAAKYVAAEGNKEAEALLKWKASLDDNHSQSVLSSWVGSSPCKWLGITCDNSGSVAHFSLPHFGLRGENKLSGFIPSSIGNMTMLTRLDLSMNNLSGSVPREIGQLESLVELGLHTNNLNAGYNHFSGPIPKSLRNCTSLFRVRLEWNQLTGNISEDFGLYPNLNYMDLSHNDLYGELTWKWRGFHNLTSLKLGQFQKNWGSLKALYNLALHNNHIFGVLPVEIQMLSQLRALNLASNNLGGSIPKQLGERDTITNWAIETVRNDEPSLTTNFSVLIPPALVDLVSLTTLDISYNELEGPIPKIKGFIEAPFEAFMSNSGLCGNTSGLKPCTLLTSRRKRNKIIILILFPLLAESDKVHSVLQYGAMRRRSYMKLSSRPLIISTSITALGKGDTELVYRAMLPTGQLVAVKKLHPSREGELGDLKTFRNEIRMLIDIRHRNIVTQWTWIGIEGLMFVKGVANALSYLHHDCSPPLIHRDISSSNVLLDLEYEANVSDFGTARLLMPDSTNWTLICWHLRIHSSRIFAELAYTMRVNEKCDVLQLWSGHNGSNNGNGIRDVIDQRIPLPENRVAEGVVYIIKIAFACLLANPQSRPTMRQVASELIARWPPLPKSFSAITLEDLMPQTTVTD